MKKLLIFFIGSILLTANAFAGSRLSGKVLCGEAPLEGVKVTDGRVIVCTDRDGNYSIDSDKKYGLVYITPPSGYVPESADGVRPGFYAALDKSSAADEVHDFRLIRQNQENYSVFFITDLHLCSSSVKTSVETFTRKAMPPFRKLAAKAAEEGPVYAFNLGDFSYERYWYQHGYGLEDAYSELVGARFPALMYSIPGNHDNDCAVLTDNTDYDAGWVYRKVLGPEYYSVDIAGDHWIFLDDIIYINAPEKGGKAWPVGSKGSINYSAGLTAAEMEWLRQDLALVGPGKRVMICTHCPILKENAAGTTFPEEQMKELAGMLSGFGEVMVYSGHLHRMQFLQSEAWPQFSNMTVTAFSGDMWESAPNRLLGIEGEDGGSLLVRFTPEGETYTWNTHLYGEKVMRCYDLNSVRKRYSEDAGIRAQMEAYPRRTDYADSSFADMVAVNYWMWREGETVEMLENGKPLKVEKVDWEDPLFNLSYYLPRWKAAGGTASSQKQIHNRHMFAARTADAASPVTVIVRDRDGRVIHRETMKRPRKFSEKTK